MNSMAFADKYRKGVRRNLLGLLLRQNNLGRDLSLLCWRLLASEVLHDRAFASDVRPTIREVMKDIQIIDIDEEDLPNFNFWSDYEPE